MGEVGLDDVGAAVGATVVGLVVEATVVGWVVVAVGAVEDGLTVGEVGLDDVGAAVGVVVGLDVGVVGLDVHFGRDRLEGF